MSQKTARKPDTSSVFVIADEYPLVCSVQFPTGTKQVNDQLVQTFTEYRFTAWMADLSEDELTRHTEEIRAAMRPLLDLARAFQAKDFESADVEAAEQAVDNIDDVQPLLERRLKRVEGLEFKRADGSVLSDDEARAFVLGHKKFRAVIEKRYGELRGEGGGGLGNLMQSAVHGHGESRR